MIWSIASSESEIGIGSWCNMTISNDLRTSC
jgi:hypothetical protein